MAMKRTTMGEFAMADIIIFPYFGPQSAKRELVTGRSQRKLRRTQPMLCRRQTNRISTDERRLAVESVLTSHAAATLCSFRVSQLHNQMWGRS